MFDRLSNIFIQAVELLEAEGRMARLEVRRLFTEMLLMLIAVAIGTTGVLALFVGTSWLIALRIGVPFTLLIMGGLAAILSVLLVWQVLRRIAKFKNEED